MGSRKLNVVLFVGIICIFAHGMCWAQGLTIAKTTIGGPVDVDFSFTTGGGLDPAIFTLNTSADNLQFLNIYPGGGGRTYTVTENDVPGWLLAGIYCDDLVTEFGGYSVVDRTLIITMPVENASIRCTFTNTPGDTSSVPTLNQWGMIVLSLLMVGSGLWFVKRRKSGA